ncbi:unnamed protein product [Oikopleura dioica]|uniref:Uncharacterized protein n=1 Tax=Oikopleura dioica TaxID=34765 RepID=E4XLD4_OIKDI|nr:unnamed protein product [Oikopleura dioica]
MRNLIFLIIALQAELMRPRFREDECPDAALGELCDSLAFAFCFER